MKILIFTEGTLLMHSGASGKSRPEIVKQVVKKEKSVRDYPSYLPVGNCVQKLNHWIKRGVIIEYLTSRTDPKEIRDIQNVLDAYKFPFGKLHFRRTNEEYKDVAERVSPDILVEDDCESIGGLDEMTYTHISPSIKAKIISVPVKEFGGIDHLPDLISEVSESR